MRVNIEGYVLLNVLVNMLLLFGCGRVMAMRTKGWRVFLASILGAGYGVAAYWPGLAFLQSLPLRMLCPAAMVCIAFLPLTPARWLRAWILFFGVTFLFGGTGLGLFYLFGLNGLPVWLSPVVVLTATALCGAWMRYERRRELRPVIRPITIEYKGCSVTMNGLLDTGLRLVNSGGLPVVVVPLCEVMDLLGEDALRLAAGQRPAHMRPLAFSALGGGGQVWSFLPDGLWIGEAYCPNCAVAITPKSLTADGAYMALVPLALWPRNVRSVPLNSMGTKEG